MLGQVGASFPLETLVTLFLPTIESWTYRETDGRWDVVTKRGEEVLHQVTEDGSNLQDLERQGLAEVAAKALKRVKARRMR